MDLIRSLLNVPADRPKMVEKAPSYGADALILDLEDAVAPAAKAEARIVAREAVEQWRNATDGPPVYVRVNGLETALLEADLDAVVVTGLRGLQVPKVHAAADVMALDARLSALEATRGLPLGSIELMVSLESARGVHDAMAILSSAPRVGAVMIGTAEDADFQGDLGYLTTPDDIATLYARSHVVLVARAIGTVHPVDGVFADVRDPNGLERAARRARTLGYRAKKLIHPNQIDIVHRVFSPTDAELDRARRIVEAMDAAFAEGRGTTTVDGRMVDVAMAATARRLLGLDVPEATA